MSLKKKLCAVAAVGVMAAALFLGSTVFKVNSDDGQVVEENLFPWLDRTEAIYFWYSDESMSSFINSAAVAFGEREQVRVIPVLRSESEYLEAINEAALQYSSLPDAYIVSHDLLEKAYKAGLATEIRDEEGICTEANFPKAALSAVTYHDKKIAYPMYFETSALIYNETYLAQWAGQAALRELLEVSMDEGVPDVEASGIEIDEALLAAKTEEYFLNAIPRTVDDILTIANTFDAPEGVEGVLKWDVSDIFYNYWFVGNYVTVGGDTGDDPEEISINSDETKACLEVYKNLNQFFYIESKTVTYESVVEDFLAGKSVFTIATTDVVKRLADAKAEGTLTFDYGIAPLPDVSEELASRGMSVTSTIAINGYSQNKELANKFAAYLVEECGESMYERGGKVSANLHANTENGALQMFKQAYADSVPLPKMMETANFWMHLEALFAKVWNGADVSQLVLDLSDLMHMQIRASEYLQ